MKLDGIQSWFLKHIDNFGILEEFWFLDQNSNFSRIYDVTFSEIFSKYSSVRVIASRILHEICLLLG